MSTTLQQSAIANITADELFRLNRGPQRHELVKGELKAISPAGFQHGVILSRKPDTVRGPDISFVTRQRIERIGIPVAYFPEAPDLAVEVVSPGDTVSEVEAKAEDWLNGGTRMLWVVSPRSRTVTVYQSLHQITVLTENETLDGAPVLTGFSCRVGELFQPLFPGNPPN